MLCTRAERGKETSMPAVPNFPVWLPTPTVPLKTNKLLSLQQSTSHRPLEDQNTVYISSMYYICCQAVDLLAWPTSGMSLQTAAGVSSSGPQWGHRAPYIHTGGSLEKVFPPGAELFNWVTGRTLSIEGLWRTLNLLSPSLKTPRITQTTCQVRAKE